MADKDGIIISRSQVWTLAHEMICCLTNLIETSQCWRNLVPTTMKTSLSILLREREREREVIFVYSLHLCFLCHFGINLQECSSHSSSPHSASASRTDRIAASIANVQCYDYQFGGGHVFPESVLCAETASWPLAQFFRFDSFGSYPINCHTI